MSNFILRNDAVKAHMIAEVAKLPVTGDVVYEVVVREFKAKRSLPSNALYWSWLTAMGKYFSGRKINANADCPDMDPEYEITDFNKDDMHDLMRHKFLGYQDRKVGKATIDHQLQTTTGMSVSSMHVYMLQIDIWATEQGCYLPRPDDSDYEKYREAAN